MMWWLSSWKGSVFLLKDLSEKTLAQQFHKMLTTFILHCFSVVMIVFMIIKKWLGNKKLLFIPLYFVTAPKCSLKSAALYNITSISLVVKLNFSQCSSSLKTSLAKINAQCNDLHFHAWSILWKSGNELPIRIITTTYTIRHSIHDF